MNSKERVMKAMNFEEPDRIPRCWLNFWPEFETAWKNRDGGIDIHADFGDDMLVVRPDETTWPSRAGVIEQKGEKVMVRTGWGDVKLTKSGWSSEQAMGQLLEPALTERIDPEKLKFEDACMDSRFDKAGKQAVRLKDDHFVWCKSGGPYLRAAFMRGETQFWIDVVEDPAWTRALVDRVVDHIISVAVEAMHRFGLEDTGIAIFDDVSDMRGPFVGPDRYEQVFLPALCRMVKVYKEAGAAKVMYHSDGNNLALLDMWVDAGIDAINPLEFRAGMDPVKIRRQYGNRLVCTGGLDNCEILPRGDRMEIRDHVLYLLDAARGGGFVIGSHSIGPDIKVETMDYVLEILEEHGYFPIENKNKKL